MVKILYTMGYICDNITEYEKLLIDNMFQSLSRTTKNNSKVRIKDLFKFLQAVHNIPTNEKFIFEKSKASDNLDENESDIDVPESDPII